MITIREKFDDKPARSVNDFGLGDTFKHNGKCYLMVEHECEGGVTQFPVNLQTGLELTEYKYGGFYPVDIEMRVILV